MTTLDLVDMSEAANRIASALPGDITENVWDGRNMYQLRLTAILNPAKLSIA